MESTRFDVWSTPFTYGRILRRSGKEYCMRRIGGRRFGLQNFPVRVFGYLWASAQTASNPALQSAASRNSHSAAPFYSSIYSTWILFLDSFFLSNNQHSNSTFLQSTIHQYSTTMPCIKKTCLCPTGKCQCAGCSGCTPKTCLCPAGECKCAGCADEKTGCTKETCVCPAGECKCAGCTSCSPETCSCPAGECKCLGCK